MVWTYDEEGFAAWRGGDLELAALLAGGGAQGTRAASEGPWSEFGGHCGWRAEGGGEVGVVDGNVLKPERL